MLDVYINGLDQGRGLQRKRRQGGETYSMEIMVFVDSGVVASHGSDIIVNYIMAIMNIVSMSYYTSMVYVLSLCLIDGQSLS